MGVTKEGLDASGAEALGKELLMARSVCSAICGRKLLDKDWLQVQLGLLQEFLNYVSVEARLNAEGSYRTVESQQLPKVQAAISQALTHLQSLHAGFQKAKKLSEARQAQKAEQPKEQQQAPDASDGVYEEGSFKNQIPSTPGWL